MILNVMIIKHIYQSIILEEMCGGIQRARAFRLLLIVRVINNWNGKYSLQASISCHKVYV